MKPGTPKLNLRCCRCYCLCLGSRGEIILSSFGFKFGSPQSNIYFDATFLPNPVRLPGKNLFDELDQEMFDFVAEFIVAKELIAKIAEFAEFMSAFDQVKIGVGCNSGRHRSVVIVEEVARVLTEAGIESKITHRDTIYQRK